MHFMKNICIVGIYSLGTAWAKAIVLIPPTFKHIIGNITFKLHINLLIAFNKSVT